MLIQKVGSLKINVENVFNMKIKKQFVGIINNNYKYKLTFDYYEPHNKLDFIPVCAFKIGFISVGMTPISLNNIYKKNTFMEKIMKN